MLPPRHTRVNWAPILALCPLLACAPDAPVDEGGLSAARLPALNGDPAVLRLGGQQNSIASRIDRLDRPIGGRMGELTDFPRRPEAPSAPREPLFDQLGAPITDGRLNMALGEALEARLAEEDRSDVRTYGVSLLSLDEMFGDNFHDGLCVSGEVSVDEEFDGASVTTSFDVPTWFWFVGDPEAYMTDLSDACVEALLASEGDVAATIGDGCIEDEEAEFFEEGSACRDCLESSSGDFAACVSAESCVAETPVEFWVQEGRQKVWYDAVQATMFACAPDRTAQTFLLANVEDDGTLPDTFDHANWAYLCIPYWDRGLTYTCFAGEGGPSIGDTLAEGVSARLTGVKTEGSDQLTHVGRMLYTHDLTLDTGDHISYFWGFTPSGGGIISMPQIIPDTNGSGVTDLGDENFGFGLGGWGMNPHALRPDGADSGVLDDTYARDWLATYALKFSTAINGIPIHIFNHNRCADGAWEGPYSDGTYRCTAMDAPEGEWILDDVDNTWTNSNFTNAYAMPMATIASTGLPDPDVPTGAVPDVAGSPALANPDWEGCTWPHSFTPDLAPMEDTPGVFGDKASLWAHTYKFGKEAEQDLRAVLVTNRLRNFCPEGW